MAQLILTDEEKSAALWTDLDDASLGKLLKKKMALIKSSSDQLERVNTVAAAMLLCCFASENNAAEMILSLDGVTQAERDFGDWIVTVMKKTD